MVRRLHIGGKVKSEGWEVLNVNPAPYVDHVCNANDLSQFSDNTFAEIYASHIVEHLDYMGEWKDVPDKPGQWAFGQPVPSELENTLIEWNRVLVPGGKLFIGVPDLDVLAKLLLEKDKLSVGERFLVMRMIFGGHLDQYDYHVIGLNKDFLARYLKASGYVNITKVQGFGLFNDTSVLSFKGVPISLNMIAEKPKMPAN
jgi:predicted SAM-dependent methyltransferase